MVASVNDMLSEKFNILANICSDFIMWPNFLHDFDFNFGALYMACGGLFRDIVGSYWRHSVALRQSERNESVGVWSGAKLEKLGPN